MSEQATRRPLPDGLSDERLRALEQTAIELARLAGTEIVNALGHTLTVRYKGGSEEELSFLDPVSEVDRQVEVMIRARVAERFGEHDILGEELEERPGRGHDFVWAVDPVDGTTNFVNGFPLFAASIGVLHRGRPVVGALWCSTSHALRAGVYHARESHGLCFEGEPIEPRPNPAVRRHLAGEPLTTVDHRLPWDTRKTGSAAIECAFVAAGLLRVARFKRPNLWDVAGGVALVRAAGGEVLTQGPGGWVPLERFDPPANPSGAPPDLRDWRRPTILGDAEAVRLLAGALRPARPA